MRGYIDALSRWNPRLCLIVRSHTHRLYSRFFRVKHSQYAQVETTTGYERYPQLFELLKQLNNPEKPLKILSFGCSTGQECVSLANHFPNALIVGVDSNKYILARARRENAHSRVRYAHLNDWLAEPDNHYDLILACSVLCRWPEAKHLDDLSDLFPFEQFQKLVKLLDDHLLPSGLLSIVNSNYCFEETDTYNRYSIHSHKHNRFKIVLDQFGTDSIKRLIPSGQDVAHAVYLKNN